MILASDPETLNTAWLFLAGVIVCVAVSKAAKRAGTGAGKAARPKLKRDMGRAGQRIIADSTGKIVRKKVESCKKDDSSPELADEEVAENGGEDGNLEVVEENNPDSIDTSQNESESLAFMSYREYNFFREKLKILLEESDTIGGFLGAYSYLKKSTYRVKNAKYMYKDDYGREILRLDEEISKNMTGIIDSFILRAILYKEIKDASSIFLDLRDYYNNGGQGKKPFYYQFVIFEKLVREGLAGLDKIEKNEDMLALMSDENKSRISEMRDWLIGWFDLKKTAEDVAFCSFHTIDSMSGSEFEAWCASLLLRNGFSKADVTGSSGDHGVDIVAEKDGIYYAIQCKCYHADLGNSPVQEVYAGKEMYKCQVGVVMTNRHFTKGAKILAERTRVLLWDRDKLQDMVDKATESV